METAIHYAIKTLVENDIYTIPLLISDIEGMILKSGFEIIPYSVPISAEYALEFETLGLLETAKKYKAFTYRDDEYKYVFCRTNLSTQERSHILAHELGHIALMHLASHDNIKCSSGLDTPQEVEAEEFALELLAPSCILRKTCNLTVDKICHMTTVCRADAERIFLKLQSHVHDTDMERRLYTRFVINKHNNMKTKNKSKKNIVFISTAIIIVFVLSFMVSGKQNINKISKSTDVAISQYPSPTSYAHVSNEIQQVAVTASGKKYHRADCPHIKNSETRTLTIAEAIKENYEPCKDCIGSTSSKK